MSPRAQASRVPEASVRRAADLFNRLLAEGPEALAPYRAADYRAPCTCGDEADEHTGPVKTGKCTRCGKCTKYRADWTHVRVHEAVRGMDAKFVDLLRAQRRADYEKRPREARQPGQRIVRFSDVGGCGRQIAYRNGLGGPVEEITVPKYDGAALAGDVVEAAVRRVNSREFPYRQYQREVRHPAIPRPGKIDEWDPVLGMVIDTKSAGDWKWEQATVFGTLRENLEQVCLYALALELEGVKVNYVRVHYVHRDDFDEDFKRHTYRWDDKMRAIAKQALVELAGRQAQLDIAEETGELPDRDRLGPTDPLCNYCFGAETEVITDEGIKQIGSIVGKPVRILDGNGKWVESTARPYGVQSLRKITLLRQGQTKVVYATPEHGWFVIKDRRKIRVETDGLRPGQRLASVRAQSAPRKRLTVSPVGIQHGFIYGDGTRSQRPYGESTAQFCGAKDAVLLKWFPNHTIHSGPDGVLRCGGNPRFFKDAPPLTEASSYLYGFLAGYFAADGTVAASGQCTITSASRRSMELVRDICARLGILTGAIRTYSRTGYGTEPSDYHVLSLDRYSLTRDFFLIEQHAERWTGDRERPQDEARGAARWQVISVEETDRIEEVFCFEVPTTHSFVLADNILTSNCDFLEVCWNTRRAEELGRTPESLTLLGEEPDEDEIERACEIIVAARRERDEKERFYKAVNNMIDPSIRPGPYGKRGRVDRNGQGYKILYAQWVPQLFEWAAREKGIDLSEAGAPPRSGPGKPIARLVGQTTAKKNAARARHNAARQQRAESDGGAA